MDDHVGVDGEQGVNVLFWGVNVTLSFPLYIIYAIYFNSQTRI